METRVYRQRPHGFSWQRPADLGPGGTAPAPRRGQAVADGARHVKKSPALLCERTEMKYAFMAQQHGTGPVAVLCEVFDVSRSGFYSYVQGHAAPTIERDEVALLARVQAIHAETRQSDGRRRRAKPLQAEGFTVGRYKARRVMHQAGVGVRRPRAAASHDHRQSASPCGSPEPARPPV